MKKNATIYDISKLAKVSIATVSRVVNNDDSVREKTRAKVLEAMNKLRYRPSTSAKAMAEGRNTTSVGVLYRFSSSGFFSELLKGIDIGLSESNCLMISSRLKEQPTSVEEIKNYIKLSGVQALLFLYPDMSPDFIDFVKMSSIPIVLIGEPCDEAGIHQVLTDNKFGIRELVQYISESNKRPNVILHGPLDNREALDRLEENKKALLESKLKIHTELAGNFQAPIAQDLLTQFLESGNAPKKFNLICHNDSMAMAAMATLKAHGIKTPKEVGVTGFDDIEFTEFFDLTTVKVPYESLGRQAVDMLMKLLKYEEVQSKVLVKPELIKRGSL